MVLSLKPFDQRKDTSLGAQEVIRRLGAKLRQVQGGIVVPLAPPPIIGLGTGGGFAYVLEDLRGGDPKALVLQMVNLGIALVIWWPFVRRYDRELLTQELPPSI